MSMEILHGRRQGERRSSGETKVDAATRNVGMSLKNVAVFQPQDWQRIQNSLTKYSAEAEEFKRRQEERKHLHLASKALVKNWGNTIEGQRLKKLHAREQREKAEEIEKKKIDVEEARLQAKQRKEAIEEARKLQYYETDRVKRFHGALLLTEVLKERDAQVGMKANRKKWEEQRDKDLVAMQRKQTEEAILQDHENAIQRMKDRRELARFQLSQISDNIDASVQERNDELSEGRDILQQVESYKAAREDIQEQRRKDKVKLREIYKDEIKSRKLLEKLKEEQEQLEDERIDRFVDAKRSMAKMRKEKEEDLFQSLQDHAEKMRMKLHSEMQQRVDDEDVRIHKAVTEQEQKRLKEEQEKSERLQKAQRDMHEHRHFVMTTAKAREQQEKRKNKELLEAHVKSDTEFLRWQKESDREKKNVAKQLQSIHKEQIRKKEDLKSDLVKAGLELDRENEALLIEEEQEFQSYARRVIDAAERNGRNKYPLVKAAEEGPGGGRGPIFEGKAGIRPSYIVADATGVQLPYHRKDADTNHRNYGHVGRSGRRLGFTW